MTIPKAVRAKYGRRGNRKKLARCLNIVRRMQTSTVYVPALAKAYGVDQRSIQRDIRDLVAAGFEIVPGDVKGWWRNK